MSGMEEKKIVISELSNHENDFRFKKNILFLQLLFITVFISPVWAGSLNGTVYNDSGKTEPNAIVAVYPATKDTALYITTTDLNGAFRFDSIIDQQYRVKISSKTYPVQWYSTNQNTLFPQYNLWIGYVNIVIKLMGSPVNNTPTSVLKVNVYDESGSLIKNVSGINLIQSWDDVWLTGKSPDSGTIIFSGLYPSTYALFVSTPPYPPQYYDSTGNSVLRSYFRISGIDTSYVRLQVTNYPKGNGYITGRCITDNGLPASGFTVSLFKMYDTVLPVYSQATLIDGTFGFNAILPDNYYLKIQGGGYPVQWFSKTRAQTVTFPDDAIKTSPDPKLDSLFIAITNSPIVNDARALIVVKVLDSTGTLITSRGVVQLLEATNQIRKNLYFDSVSLVYKAEMTPAGKYSLSLDMPGYDPQFYTPTGNTLSDSYKFYVNSSDTLYLRSTMIGKKMDTLQLRTLVTGIISDSSKVFRGANIKLLDSTGMIQRQTFSDSSGMFTMNVSTGVSYCLAIDAPGYPPQFWSRNGSTLQIGNENYFSVASGTVFKTNVALIKSAIIKTADSTLVSGTITDKKTGKPVSMLKVMLIPPSLIFPGFDIRFLSSEYTTQTDIGGSFKFVGIPLNKYLLVVNSDTSGYIPQFYPGVDSIINAIPLELSNSMSKVNVTMGVSPDGIIKGTVKTENGQPIPGVRVNAWKQDHSSDGYFAETDSTGVFKIKGLRTGSWGLGFYSDFYMLRDGIQKDYQVSEGITTDINTVVMIKGGYITGTYRGSAGLDTVTSSHMYSAQISMIPDTLQGNFLWPVNYVFTSIKPFAASNQPFGTFYSSLCKTGKYKLIFVPNPLSQTNAIADTFSFKPNFGWSFISNDTSVSGPQVFQINPDDTLRNVSVKIRNGYSICGTITCKGQPLTSNNYWVSAFVKIDTTYYQVSSAFKISGSRFELPGLVKDEEYFIQVWVEGLPSQFWSKEGNSLSPKYSYKIDTLSPLIISVTDTLKNTEIQKLSSPISLQVFTQSSSAGPVLKWNYDKTISIDTFKIYRMDRYDRVTIAANVPAKLTIYAYDFTDALNPADTKVKYIVTGKGKSNLVRSNQFVFDTRSSSMAPNQAWMDVFIKNKSIVLEWGVGDSIRLNETDSVSVYRKKGTEIWSLHTKRSAFERQIWDYDWVKDDSGKIFQYKIELPSKMIQTDIQSIKIDTSLVSFRPEIVVGPYEKYKSIQLAIDAAVEFDHIRVRAGTYKENLNFKGKSIMLYGDWEFGKPPVIDGAGGVAITVPITANFPNGFPNIEGFKITNALIGIMAKSNLTVNRCLFTSVAKSIESSLDSSAVITVLKQNPFAQSSAYIYVSHCTFIASGTGNYVASSNMAGSAEVSSGTQSTTYDNLFYVNPLLSWGTNVEIHNSSLSYYYTRAKISELPLKLSGNSSRIGLVNCNLWQTLSSAPVNVKVDGVLQTADPQFIDTTWYFTPDTSLLKTSNIGYDKGHYSVETRQEPGAIKNLQIKILGLAGIGLKWDPAPVSDKVQYYRVYRAPGDTSMYYVNQDSTWDIKKTSGIVDTVLKKFTIQNPYFIDTTVIPGKPYLYVVAAVDSSGNEGRIKMSYPPDITQYFVNTYQYQYKVKGGVWLMVGPWGTAPMSVATNQNVSLYTWNDKAESSKLLSQYSSVTEMKPGNGYWLKSIKDTVLKVSTVLFDSLENKKNVNLIRGASGWNQFSSPYPFTVSPSWLSTLAIWEWNPDSLGYTRATNLKPWNSYWINVSRDTTLPYIDTVNWLQNNNLLAKRMNQNVWELTISLKGKAAWDPENKIGVIKGTLNKNISSTMVQEPPEAFGASQLYFVNESNNKSQKLSYLYKNINDASKGKFEWSVCITPSDQSATVNVKDVNTLPKGIFVYWVNEKSVQDLRENNEISIPKHDENMYGYIVATTNRKDIALYQNNFLMQAPYPNPFRNKASIQITIPYAWLPDGSRSSADYRMVELVIYDLGGRKVKTLLNGKISVGTHYVNWNGDSEHNGQVSTGLYLVRLRCDSFVKTSRLCRIR